MSGPKEKTSSAGPADIVRYKRNIQEEVNSAALYRAMAAHEPSSELSKVYGRLADVEERHASFWEDQLRRAGEAVPPRKIGVRSRMLGYLARKLGPAFVAPTIAAAESTAQNDYAGQRETGGTGMHAQEQSHARLLRLISSGSPKGISGGALSQLEGRHPAVGGNALRAAVLGANDGLLSNLSLVMGVAGASLEGRAVLVTGVAGLLAGAFSMALGEWVSVQSSRELFERQIEVERGEIESAPAEEAEELQLIFEAKGIPPGEAKTLAERLISDESTALDALAREELGIDPKELGGSPWTAALTSFVLFASGAIIPVLPFVFSHGWTAVCWSVGLSAFALFTVGAAITLVTGRSAWASGFRQVLLGLCAAGVTFGIGKLMGVAIAG